MRPPKNIRTWIEIDRAAIAHNYRLFRSLIPKGTRLAAVVKSNAYGHYLVDFAKEVEKLGIDFLAVDSFVEGVRLREEGVRASILVLGYTLPDNFSEAARLNISLAVSSPAQLAFLEKKTFARMPKIHIKVDTGMHRQGFTKDDMPRVAAFLARNAKKPRVAVEGLFTHFAGAKNAAEDHTPAQIAEFREWIDAFTALDYFPMVHAAASGGTLLFPDAHFDMVRIGIGLYGIWPSDAIEKKLGKRIRLAPVLSWRTVISEVKELPRGAHIGYDRTEALKRKSRVAVCPIGYWHGFPRAHSSKGRVLVHGEYARVLGRVSMDMISIDVTNITGVRAGDVVTIVGADGKRRLRAEEVGREAPGSSAYEFVTRLNPLIKRVFV